MGTMGISKRKISLIVIIFFLTSAVLPFNLSYSEGTAVMPVIQKGMCYVTWDKDRFASDYSDESLKKLSDLGVEYLSICITYYQEKYNSTQIRSTEKTPSKRSIAHVVKKAHKLGMKVMLKPHIDLMDGYDGTYWRADIGFAVEKDWEKWFNEYEGLIVKYAKMAQKYNVDIFCVGTELSFTTQKEDKWREVIKSVRKAYDGKLIYAANWDNFKNVAFWDELDYVGIDAYFPLTYEADPSVEELKKGWERWKNDIKYWQSQIDRPVIFTELGYASTSHAPYSPWKGGYSGNADIEIQARCYQAFFETIWNEPWFAGVYWWKWDTNTRAGGKHNRQFTPQNKPAQQIIASHYKGDGTSKYYAKAE